MCTPAAIPLALTAISTAYSVYQGNQQAQAGVAAAEAAAAADRDLLGKQASQINASASMDKLERQRQGMREQAKIRTAAGEAGALGNSTLRMLNNSMLQEGHDTGIVESNRQNAMDQNQARGGAVNAELQSRTNEAMSHYTNPLMAGLQIGVGAGSDYLAMKRSPYSTEVSTTKKTTGSTPSSRTWDRGR
jgi:hypothetical protein